MRLLCRRGFCLDDGRERRPRGRPRKHPSEVRRNIGLRLTEEERKYIVKHGGVDYVRRLIQEKMAKEPTEPVKESPPI